MKTIEQIKCDKCGSLFNEGDHAVIYKAEYPGGYAWPWSVSPCCLYTFTYNETYVEVKS